MEKERTQSPLDVAMQLLKIHLSGEQRNEIAELKQEIFELRHSLSTFHQNGSATSTADSLVTQREICEHLSISTPTLIKMRRRKEVPFIRAGRKYLYSISAVSSALNKSRQAK